MNAPVLLAQLAGSSAQAPAVPKNLKIEKPQNGQALTVHLDGTTKLDLADIASERLTFVRVGEKLIILFDNQSTVTVDPVFDNNGRPLTDLAFDMGADRTLSSEQFAQTFPITTDQSVLPAAGGATGPTGGASFSDASVSALGASGARLNLLAGEDGAGDFGSDEDRTPNATPNAGGVTAVILNEDGFAGGNRGGSGDAEGVATSVTGSLNVNFGTDSVGRNFSFSASQPALQNLTSGGEAVQLAFVNIGGVPTLIGYVGSDFNASANQVFTVTLNVADTGDTYTFTLLRPLDHPLSGTVEETINLVINVIAADGSSDATPVTLEIGINDDTPTIAAVGQSSLTDPLAGSPAVANGSLGISWGADRFNTTVDGGVSSGNGDRSVFFASDAAAVTGSAAGVSSAIATLTSHGETVHYVLLGNGAVLVAYTGTTAPTSLADALASAAPSGEGEGQSGGNIVFIVTLSDASNAGAYTVTQYRSLDHDSGQSTFEAIDLAFNFTATDSDGDTVSSVLHVVVNDTVPVITGPVASSTLGEAISGENGPGSEMPARLAVSSDGAFVPSSSGDVVLNIDWRSDNQNLTAGGGAHERSVTFASTTQADLVAMNLTSDGAQIRYEISSDGTLLTAYVQVQGGEGEAATTRTVFTVQLSDDGSGSYNFTLVDNIDHASGNGKNDQLLTFSFVATDSDGDKVSSSFSVTIVDDAPSIGSPQNAQVDERAFGNGEPSVVSNSDVDTDSSDRTVGGTLNITWGADDANSLGNAGITGSPVNGDRAVTFDQSNKTALLGLGLTHNGALLSYEISADGLTLTAKANGEEIFNVRLSDEGSGSYIFTLTRNIDHAANSESLNLSFAFTATDGDGDTAQSSFTVTVLDDGPTITNPASAQADESAFGNGPVSSVTDVEIDKDSSDRTVGGKLGISWGADDGNKNGNAGITGSPVAGDRAVTFDESNKTALLELGLTHNGADLSYEISADGLTLTAKANGEEIFNVKLSDEGSGTYIFTLTRNIDHASNSNSLDLNFAFSATDSDGDKASSSFTVTVLDDGPTIGKPASAQADESAFGNGPVVPVTDTDIDQDGNNRTVGGKLGISWGADDGNKNGNAGITGSPVAGDRAVTFDESNKSALLGLGLTHNSAALSYEISADGLTLTAKANGEEIFTVKLSDEGSGSYIFTLTRNIDHAPNSNSLDLNFAFTATDSDGDTAQSSFKVTVLDDGPTITNPASAQADESAFGNGPVMPVTDTDIDQDGNNRTVGGKLGISWGADDGNKNGNAGITGSPVAGDRAVTFDESNKTALLGLGLTHNSAALSYEISADGLTLTAKANGEEIFTVRLSDEGSGSYIFTLTRNIDHAPNSNSLDLNFAFTATDSDGDTAQSTFTVKVLDDGPTITNPASAQANESAFGNGPVVPVTDTDIDQDGNNRTVGGKLGISWGADDGNNNGNAGITGSSVAGDRAVTFDQSSKTALLGLGLTHNGAALSYEISADGLTLTAKANGEEIFTVKLSDEGSGSYIFTLTRNIDHAPNSNSLDLNFAFTATDSDGDTAQSTFTVKVLDDGPTITNPASAQADESAFGNGPVVPVTDTDIDQDGNNRTVGGKLGISWGADDGNKNGNAGITGSPVNGDRAVTFDQSNKTALLGLHLTHNGAALSYEISADGLTLTAKANGEEIFTVRLSDEGSGSYIFTLTRNIDHAPNSNSLDLSFAFTATDGDGDTAGASFTVKVLDDAPTITSPASAQADERAFGNGPASPLTDTEIDTDSNTRTVGGKLGISWGADDANNGGNIGITGAPVAGDRAVTFDQSNKTALLALGLKHNGAALSYEISADGLTLTAKANGEEIFNVKLSDQGSGSYIFTLTRNIDHAANSNSLNLSFAFTATDSDGDTAGSSFTVKVLDDAPTIGSPASSRVDEDDLPAGNKDGLAPITDASIDTDTSKLTVGGKLGISWGADDGNNSVNGGINGAPVNGDRAVTFDQETITALTTQDLKQGGVSLSYELASNGTVLLAKAGGQEVFRVTLSDRDDGSYIFKLSGKLDHSDTSSEDNLALTFKFVATDSDGDTATSSFKVTVNDDAPTAAGETATVAESAPSQGSGNIILAFDRSGSMGDDPDGQGGYSSRLQLAKLAAINLLNASNADQVLIVTFSDSATASAWMTKAQAIAFINGGSFPGANGGTNYDNATSAIINATIPSGATSVYFFSDGSPTDSGYLSNSERAAWEGFLQGKGMTSYAVGVGGSISGSDGDLNDIAYPGSPLIISTANDPALLGTISPAIPTSASGNVLSNDSFGADGGRILSITVGNVTYTWNGAASIATSNGGTIAGSALTVTTGINGVLTFNFATGVWSYNAPGQLVTNATETFTYRLIDGDGDAAEASLVINVTAVNDAPVNNAPNALSVDEDNAIIFNATNQNAISISDVDHNGGNETVKISVLHGNLTLSGTAGLVVSGNGSGQVTVTGTVDAINAALNGLKYQPVNNYNGSDTLTIVTNDNGNYGIGGAKSDTDTIAITIKPVNDAPVLAPDTNEISFTENGSAVKLMSNATVADPDNPANFDGGSVTVSLGTSAVTGDQLIFASNSGVTLSGNNVRINGTTIGTVTGYGTSTLTITFDDDATNSVVQTVLRALAYQSVSDNPTAADRTVTVTFNDGGNAGSGVALSDSSTITIHVTPVNDAPVNALPGSATVNEDNALLFSAANGNAISISDVDANGSNETVKLSVQHGTLTLADTAGLSVAGNGSGTVTITGSVAAINAALDGLKYQPANNYNGSDTLTVVTNDNGNSGTGGAKSDTDNISITIRPMNDAPVLAPDSNEISYTENALPVKLMPNATVSDPDNPSNFPGGSVSVSLGTSAVSGDQIVFASNSGVVVVAGVIWIGITAVGTVSGLNTTTVTISFGLGASDANVETVLRALAYQSTSENPTAADRTVTVTFNDGGNDGNGPAMSDTSTITVHVTPVNDAPVAVNDTGSATEKGGTANGSGGSNATGNVLTNDSDVDNPQNSLQVSGIRVGTSGTPGTVGTALVGDHGTLTLNADGSYTYVIDQTDSVVQGLNVGNTTTDTFTYTVRDPSGATDTARLTITINGANDAPIAVNDTGSATEKGGVSNGSGGSIASGNVRTNDTDVDNTTSSLVISAVRTGAEAGTGTSGTVGSSLNGLYGSLKLNSDGSYTYTINDSNSTVQALNVGQTLTDTFTYTVRDGGNLNDTAQLVITINGANDAAVINGTLSGTVKEAGGVLNTAPGTPTATGTATVTDVDSAETFVVQNNVVTTYGTFSIGTDGAWTYNLNNANSAVQGLKNNGVLHDLITITTADGTTKQIDITINGTNDAAVLSSASVNLTETNSAASINTNGQLTISDVDNPATFATQTNVAGLYGKFSITATGAWTYTANDAHDEFKLGQTYTDSFSVSAADGTLTTVVINIAGTNDAPVLTVTNGTNGAIGDSFQGGYSGATGTPNLWTTNWTESGDDNQQNSGDILIRTDIGGNSYLRLGDSDGSNSSIQRTVNLSGTASATLSFKYRYVGLDDSNDQVFVQVSTNGVTFTQIAVLGGDVDDNGFQSISLDLSAYRSGTTTIRFVASSGLDNNDYVYIDDVSIAYTREPTYTENGAAVAIVSDAVLTDPDDTQMASATVALTNKQAGDQLLINTTLLSQGATGTIGGVSYAVTETSGAITITFSGAATRAAYEAAIEAVKFASSSENPSTVDRTFQIVVNDGNANSNTATSVVHVVAVNDAPVAADDAGSATEKSGVGNGTAGSNATGNVLTNDTDAETPSALVVSAVRAGTEVGTGNAGTVGASLTGTYGTLTLNANGTYTYVVNDNNSAVQALNVGGTLTETFTYTVADPNGLTDRAQLVITINGANDAAVISGAINGIVTEAGGLNNAVVGTPSATGTLTNTDVDNPANTFQAVLAATGTTSGYGTYTMTAGGVWTFTLNNANTTVQGLTAGQTLTDTFMAKTQDGTSQLVTITINGANDTAVISGTITGTVTEDVTLSATGQLTVADPDAGQSSFQAVTAATGSIGGYGTYTVTALGAWIYNVNNGSSAIQSLGAGQTLTDTFKVKSVDGTEQVVTVTINGTNDSAVIGTPTVASVTEDLNPVRGILKAIGTISLSDADTGQATFNTTVTAVGSVLGSLVLSANGNYTYSVDNSLVQYLGAGQTRVETFTISSIDGTTKNVSFTINGANDAPTLSAIESVTYNDTAADDTFPAVTGTLASTDADTSDTKVFGVNGGQPSSALSGYNIAANGPYGVLYLNSATGAYRYEPKDAVFEGLKAGVSETFTLTVTDGSNATTTQNFTVVINGTNDTPTITGAVTANLTETDAIQTTGGTLNVVDRDAGDSFFVAQADVAGTNGYGKFTIGTNGVWTYVMNSAHDEFVAGQTYTDTLTVKTVDGTTRVLTVNIAGTNDAAVITGAIAGTAVEPGYLTTGSSASGDLNSTDVDGSADAWTVVSTATATTTGYGKYTIDATGHWTYTVSDSNATVNALQVGQHVTDTFTVQTTDGTQQVVTVTINGANDAPVANDDGTMALGFKSVDQNVVTTFSASELLANDTDPEGDTLMIHSLGVTGTGATLTMDEITGVISYDPRSILTLQKLAVGQIHSDSFTYVIDDGHGALISATGYITIIGTNDAPIITSVISDAKGTVVEDAAVNVVTGQLTADDIDNDASAATRTWTISGTPAYGSIAIDATGKWTYTLNNSLPSVQALGDGQQVTEVFTAMVTDNHGASATQTVTVTVTGTNDAPVLTGDRTATVAEGGTYTITTDDLGFADVDDVASGETFTASSLNGGVIKVNGTETNTFTGAQLAAGQVTFVHNGGEAATAGFQVSVEDGNEDNSALVNQAFTFTVSPVNDGAATLTVADSTQTVTAPKIGDVLQSTLGVDPDGTKTNVVYQWLSDGVNIANATGASYTIVAGDLGHAISLKVTYTDGQGFGEAVTSAPTAAVIGGVNHAPVLDSARTVALLDEANQDGLTTGANIAPNGSFEGSLAGWTTTGSIVLNSNAHSGSTSAATSSSGTLSYTFDTVIGQQYVVHYWFSSSNTTSGSGQVDLKWNGASVWTVSQIQNGGLYYDQTFTVIATGTSSTIQFALKETSSSKVVNLDDVTISPAVPPAGVGTLVSSLVGIGTGPSNVTDVDAAAKTGIAITSVANTLGFGGSWYYQLAGSSVWVPFGNVSTSNALLLPPDAKIYLEQSQSNDIGTGTITFRAWDQTSGTIGGKADTTVNGGSTAFSTATDTASLNIRDLTYVANPQLTNGADTVSFVSGTHTVSATVNNMTSGSPAASRTQLNASDRLQGAGHDQLNLTVNANGGGSTYAFNFGTMTSSSGMFTGFDRVNVMGNPALNVSLTFGSANVVSGQPLTVDGSATTVASTKTFTVDASGVTNGGSFVFVAGNFASNIFKGGTGDDTYVFGMNNTSNTVAGSITEKGGSDRIRIASGGADIWALNAYDDNATSNAGNLVIEYNGQQITVVGHYGGAAAQLESIAFDGGSVFGYNLGTAAYLINALDPADVSGQRVVDLSASTTDNFIAGENGTVDKITGGSGRDLIFGGTNDDVLNGGGGNDLIVGGAGNDTITGGLGNDTLVGGNGNDTYVFGLADSNDTIREFSNDANSSDRIVIATNGAAMSGLTAFDNNAATFYGDLVIQYNGQQITVQNQYLSGGSNEVEAINFDGGSVYGYNLGSSDYAILSGLTADPSDFSGYRTIALTSGNNFVAGELGTANKITGGSGNDLVFGGDLADILSGGAGNDLLVGGAGNDTLWGGLGNDVLVGGTGADTFKFGAGEIGASNLDKIIGFSHSEGDKIDLSGLLDSIGGVAANGSNIGSYVQLTQIGNDLSVKVDTTGNGNFSGTTHDVATLVGYGTSNADIVNMVFKNQDHTMTA